MSEIIKKRKWDQDDHGEAGPDAKTTKVDIDPSKAVSEAAARINAMLAQKGIPLHDEVHGLSESGGLKNEGEFVKDIPINDLKNRYMLTRGATQTQIQQETGADVITRGKYYPDVQLASDREPPLYLHITASNKQSLDKAIAKIEELIETSQVPLPGSGYPPRDDRSDMMNKPPHQQQHQQHQRPERKFYEKRLPVDIGGTPHFNLRAKIVGPNGAFVKHIQQETGCRVQLKGKGSGFYESSTGVESEEPLHVHISCPREEGLEAGVKLTQDLLDTVKAEAERGPPTNQYGYGRGGYSNNNSGRNGYNTGYNAGYSGYHNAGQSTGEVDPATAQSYDAYNNYYNNYYAQPQAGQQQQYGQYDAAAYYSYYGYTPVDPNAAASGSAATSTPPPPPAAVATAASSSASSPPPPPPPSSNPPPPPPTSSPPPPPPPASSSAPPPPPPPPSAPEEEK